MSIEKIKQAILDELGRYEAVTIPEIALQGGWSEAEVTEAITALQGEGKVVQAKHNMREDDIWMYDPDAPPWWTLAE